MLVLDDLKWIVPVLALLIGGIVYGVETRSELNAAAHELTEHKMAPAHPGMMAETARIAVEIATLKAEVAAIKDVVQDNRTLLRQMLRREVPTWFRPSQPPPFVQETNETQGD